MPGHTRLARRGRSRAAVPQDIKSSHPKAEETFSLKTKDYADALRLVRLTAAEVDGRLLPTAARLPWSGPALLTN
ncbi:DUF6538 domain-containing protein [Paracoccus sp. DMF]|uniref:DUF6538 domain-containing protein n=1 Tax=Paracoccus sp. DMF TaxID=400837 RepID=UPI00398CE44A|nr:hypothetical protein [Paracoccus sp. DMF]